MRSQLPEVRNPLLALPSIKAFLELPPEVKKLLRNLLLELNKEARHKADESWRKFKGPMAVYWRAVAAYSRHLARCLK